MSSQEQLAAPCGLICSICGAAHEFGCPGCYKGGGPDPNCVQLNCSKDRNFIGCWECNEFPCGNGMFSPMEPLSGLCIASVECIKENGIAEHVEHTIKNVGKVMPHQEWFKKTPEEAREKMCKK